MMLGHRAQPLPASRPSNPPEVERPLSSGQGGVDDGLDVGALRPRLLWREFTMRRNWFKPSSFLDRYFGVVIAVGLVAGLSALAAFGYTP